MECSPHIGPKLKVLGTTIDRRLTSEVQKLGLTSSQVFLLHYLSRTKDSNVTLSDIERKFELSHATVSGLVSRLESKGFVKCITYENDRRFKNIIITDKALEVNEEVGKHIEETERQLMLGFSTQEREQLEGFFIRMMQNMDIPLKNNN